MDRENVHLVLYWIGVSPSVSLNIVFNGKLLKIIESSTNIKFTQYPFAHMMITDTENLDLIAKLHECYSLFSFSCTQLNLRDLQY